MEFTVTFKMEPEDFGRIIASVPADVRQQMIDAMINAYPQMWEGFMKSSGFLPQTSPSQNTLINPFFPWMNFLPTTKQK